MERSATFGAEGGPFHVTSKAQGDFVRLVATGELDVDTAPLLADAGALAVAWSPEAIDLDLGGVSFVDSSGLRVLLTIWQAAEEEGIVVRFDRLSAGAKRLLEITGVIERLRSTETGPVSS